MSDETVTGTFTPTEAEAESVMSNEETTTTGEDNTAETAAEAESAENDSDDN